jgi:NADPH:quinone reductase-like Zn-dependent oxidoreductase
MLDALIDCQAKLIAALDAQDADAILSASEGLAAAVATVRTDCGKVPLEQVTHGLKQAEAASIRVKYLTAWNRQKIDRLAEFRGHATANIYGNMRLSR